MNLTLCRMQGDLKMDATNNGYSITSLVFFITYTIFQIPATVIIRKIGPRLFLSGIVLFWGAVMLVSDHEVNSENPMLTDTGIRFRSELGDNGWPTYHSWCLGSRSIPR